MSPCSPVISRRSALDFSSGRLNSSRLISTYASGEQLQSREAGQQALGRGLRGVHGLRQHQEQARHQEQEEVEEEQRLQEEEVGEHAGAEAPAHPLERHLPQLQGVQEGEPAVPGLSSGLWGVGVGWTTTTTAT